MTVWRSRSSTPPWNSMASLLLTGAWWLLCMAPALAVPPLVPQGPSLTILPTSTVQVKPEGRNALLTCRAQGDGAKHVTGLRWRAPDGREVPVAQPGELSRPKVYAESFQTGGSLSLIFTELKSTDEGNYTCEGQYAGGELLQRSVEIRVIKAIRWLDAPLEQYPKQGERFKVKCKVEAEPPPTVDWQKDGAPLDQRYEVETDGVVIPSPDPSDDGVYTCRAIVVATGELQSRAIKVEVQVPPDFQEKVRNVTVAADKHETIECQADAGRPPPEYRWIFERTGADLLQKGGRFQVDPISGALRISPVHADDDGVYKCVARNRAGDARQRVNMEVRVPPRVVVVKNVTGSQGKPGELTCEARGRPLPSIEWRRHGEKTRLVPGVQSNDKRISTSSRAAGPEHPDRTDGFLSWDNLDRSDDGLYACIATNEAGTAEKLGHLTVEFPPSFNNTPYNTTWSWEQRTANITCLAESIPNATIHWFLNDRDIEKYPDTRFTKVGKGPQSNLLVKAEFGEARYGFYKCKAKNIHGEAEHIIQLKKAEKPGSLLQAVVDAITATTLKFKLVGPSDNGGIPTTAYSVRYRKVDEPSAMFMTHSWPADSDYTLENLEPQTHYEFDFSATNEVGDGPWSAKVTKVMPRRSPPEPPTLLHRPAMSTHPEKPMDRTDTPFMATSPTHFELKWRIPAHNGAPLKSYTVSWCKAKETEDGLWVQDLNSYCQEKYLDATEHTTSCRLQPLQPDTLYMVHIYASNEIGTSQPSALLLKTPLGAPRPGDTTPAAAAPALSSGALIATVVVSLLVALLLLDLTCFACRRAGVIAALCERARGKEAPDGVGVGPRYGASGTKESLRDETSPLAPAIATSVKRDTSALFDGKNTTTVSRPIIGKDSAV